MFTQSDSHPPLKTRKHTADEINQALTRFPLVVQVLGELRKANLPYAGDEDIRHGCERALTSMLVELARIEPAAPGKVSKAEESALALLQSKTAALLVNADQLQRIQQFIERILGPQPNPH
jgi:hypothetical protein